jgi:prepilin-type N-terminal cleavage/methylation domain-containing protein
MRREAGFTLLEMLIALAVSGVMMAIASPIFFGYQQNLQMREVNNAVAQSLQEIGACALRSNTSITVTFTLNDPAAMTVPSGCLAQTFKFENNAKITSVTSSGVALSPLRVVFTARGWPSLNAPVVFTTQLGSRTGTIRLLLSGKTVIQ